MAGGQRDVGKERQWRQKIHDAARSCVKCPKRDCPEAATASRTRAARPRLTSVPARGAVSRSKSIAIFPRGLRLHLHSMSLSRNTPEWQVGDDAHCRQNANGTKAQSRGALS